MISPTHQLEDESVSQVSKGVIKDNKRWYCIQCGNTSLQYFVTYNSTILDKTITYCRRCIHLGRTDSITDICIVKSFQKATKANYKLPFELSKQQQYASEAIVQAIKNNNDLLLYAVTGAGKTEMMFEGIRIARQMGHNIAIVSPRVDVIIEISHRIKDAFIDERIDVLHQSSRQQYNGHFVIATIHQLLRFKQHFDTVFVDEVDAFPLSMDPQLSNAIQLASKLNHSHIFMTATPPRHFLKQFPPEKIIKLPARFHRHPLPIPKFKYFKLKSTRKQNLLLNLFRNQINQQRFTLVFFNNIEIMNKTYQQYKMDIADLICVHSEDDLRFEKIEDLRRGQHKIVFTTTILERGFTMTHLDVVVVDAGSFQQEALIQIAGRVGRKQQSPSGLVLFLHEGVTLSMILAKRNIISMNRLAIKRGWVDA
ncbi:DEAD/DEAH box helicase family protein [Staphylococcus epidermidis]|uniref:DEAD/DEAH box helicase family protein n=1 Tax=Staphylococcus epidermidis TaxID=1282 RepID=UPI0029F243D1|nr:DEAD/DEAH box helicase family protein [Staphylococcus epidermidis]MCG2183860.1 DEAD/DEAH box helicase family protein [Staphylococcus epidermidis]MCG2382066.1 DEAD/DEAH box helicase family protein [Staphylococcus epidermidis]MCG2433690.1 DEAD/DEAH box helicase family protein [Staphylococcus epidermidis]MCG2489220.1 DEAD/DEAH box helicase family protein [Staphylococcus epidermidis]